MTNEHAKWWIPNTKTAGAAPMFSKGCLFSSCFVINLKRRGLIGWLDRNDVKVVKNLSKKWPQSLAVFINMYGLFFLCQLYFFEQICFYVHSFSAWSGYEISLIVCI